ncbi:MAG: FGGY family carbohydrate kinase [Planctomycetia bacterium]|nr:FGGY family carbohydrate kinase [Planctomycetia bacterium]
MEQEYTLGIDLGTGSVKCILRSLDGTQRYHAHGSYRTYSSHPGWMEQDPRDWIIVVRKTLDELYDTNGLDRKNTRAIGICGAAHIGVLLDKKDAPCLNAILWNDCRTIKETNLLRKEYLSFIEQETLNQPGCSWTLPHLLWLREHHREEYQQAVSFLTSKDYLVFLLTGVRVMDHSSATSTLLYNPRKQTWSDTLCEISRLRPEVFPEVVDSCTIIGTTSAHMPFDLPVGIPVIAGALDSICEFRAVATTDSPTPVLRLGTAGGVVRVEPRSEPVRGIFVYPFPRGGYLRQAATTSCGQSLEWIRRVLAGTGEKEVISFDDVDCLAGEVSPGSDGLFFHPYLQGERAPYERPSLKGSFTGLTVHHDTRHLIRAVLEGTAFSLRDAWLVDAKAQNGRTQVIRGLGGAIRSHVWMSIMTNVLARPIQIARFADSCDGVACFASESINVPVTLPSENSPFEKNLIVPDNETASFYDLCYSRYRRIADSLVQLF